MASVRRAHSRSAADGQNKNGKRTRRKFFNLATGFDMHFFVLLMIILIVGLATLYSASHVYAFNHNDGNSYYYIFRQGIFAAIGFVAMLLISTVDYHILHRFAWPLWIVGIGMLVLPLVMPSETGIRRWIHIGSFTFQPSEIAKFALVLLFAHYISLNHKKMKKFTTGFMFPMIPLGITCALVLYSRLCHAVCGRNPLVVSAAGFGRRCGGGGADGVGAGV